MPRPRKIAKADPVTTALRVRMLKAIAAHNKKCSDATVSATLYARISDDTDGDAEGVENQIVRCIKLCAERGWAIRDLWFDNDISATTGAYRPDFEGLLLSKPEVIVTFHTDRLVRRTDDLERVINLGVNVHAITAGHLDLSTPAGRAVARTITAWATYEGEQKAERQKLAAQRRALDGIKWWPNRPFGHEMDGTLRQDEAEAIRKACKDLLAGGTIRGITRELNAAGFRTSHGNPWRSESVGPMLKNPRLAGLRAYWGEIVGPAQWEAVVDEETWQAVSHLLRDPARRTGGGNGAPKNLLTGFAECGKCGGLVKVMNRGKVGAPGSYRVYTCRDNFCMSHRQEWTDKYVEERIIAILSSEGASQVWTDDGAADASAELRGEVVLLRERLEAIAVDYADGAITRAQMLAATDRLRAKLEQAETALGATNSGRVLVGLRGDEAHVRKAWADLDIDRQRAVVRTLIEGITLKPRPKGGRGLMKPSDVYFLGDDEEDQD